MYNKEQLSKGAKVELEHTRSRAVATKIAKDHLNEDPDYYRKLAIMESTPYEKMKTLKKAKNIFSL